MPTPPLVKGAKSSQTNTPKTKNRAELIKFYERQIASIQSQDTTQYMTGSDGRRHVLKKTDAQLTRDKEIATIRAKIEQIQKETGK